MAINVFNAGASRFATIPDNEATIVNSIALKGVTRTSAIDSIDLK